MKDRKEGKKLGQLELGPDGEIKFRGSDDVTSLEDFGNIFDDNDSDNDSDQIIVNNARRELQEILSEKEREDQEYEDFTNEMILKLSTALQPFIQDVEDQHRSVLNSDVLQFLLKKFWTASQFENKSVQKKEIVEVSYVDFIQTEVKQRFLFWTYVKRFTKPVVKKRNETTVSYENERISISIPDIEISVTKDLDTKYIARCLLKSRNSMNYFKNMKTLFSEEVKPRYGVLHPGEERNIIKTYLKQCGSTDENKDYTILSEDILKYLKENDADEQQRIITLLAKSLGPHLQTRATEYLHKSISSMRLGNNFFTINVSVLTDGLWIEFVYDVNGDRFPNSFGKRHTYRSIKDAVLGMTDILTSNFHIKVDDLIH